MIRLREYQDGDMALISNSIENTITDNHCMEASSQGMFVTLERDGIPVATGGLVMKDEDTAEAWAKIDMSMTSGAGIKDRIRLVRAFSEALDLVAYCLGFPLVYSVVQEGFVRGERLAKVLGFKRIDDECEREGIKYNYYKRSA